MRKRISRLHPRSNMGLILAGVGIGLALAGTAVAAGVVTSQAIKDGTIKIRDLSPSAVSALSGNAGPRGPAGADGASGTDGARGAVGPAGPTASTFADHVPLTGAIPPIPTSPSVVFSTDGTGIEPGFGGSTAGAIRLTTRSRVVANAVLDVSEPGITNATCHLVVSPTAGSPGVREAISRDYSMYNSGSGTAEVTIAMTGTVVEDPGAFHLEVDCSSTGTPVARNGDLSAVAAGI